MLAQGIAAVLAALAAVAQVIPATTATNAARIASARTSYWLMTICRLVCASPQLSLVARMSRT
jgi:hypothetical protein